MVYSYLSWDRRNDTHEIGALRLYTAESELYPRMNALLRARDRKALLPFFPYLRLLLTAWTAWRWIILTGSAGAAL